MVKAIASHAEDPGLIPGGLQNDFLLTKLPKNASFIYQGLCSKGWPTVVGPLLGFMGLGFDSHRFILV